ncbi:MAG: RNA-binding transcriptional accessory protein, partial [Bacteroidetes bacterium]
MPSNHTDIIAKELGISRRQVTATLSLLQEGATIPFMARYRKEVTGSLDEVALATIRDRAEQLAQLDKRRDAIIKSLQERELLSDELKAAIGQAQSMAELEDLYLPYRPKRRTRATIAREKGLEPLAKILMEQKPATDPELEAAAFVNEEKGVADTEEALKGARDIIAEWINEDKEARERMRNLYRKRSMIQSKVIKGKEEEGAKYKDYFDWSEPLSKVPSHRLLAMRRGEKELILSLTIGPEEEDAVALLERRFVKGSSATAQQVKLAVKDAYKRLMGPSMETEMRIESKDKADEEAIRVFVDNLRQLLLSAPLGEKAVLAVDPGFRTGCKVVCLDRQG